MLLNTLRAPYGASKNKKRVGRGESSGHGKTSGRGHKGQKARSGGYHKVGFEGGQMPLVRRLPKRGFTNIFRAESVPVNVGSLEIFEMGTVVNAQALRDKRLVRKKAIKVRILGKGTLTKKLTIEAHHFSKTAKEMIEKLGGTATIIK